MSKQTARRGFTITELVIVIVVIAILAAVLIPTFVSLIKKANSSADMQAVRQMNTILTAEEVVDGKPATVAQAKEILTENGITDFTPMEEANTFYWVGSENRVLLWTEDEVEAGQAQTGKVVFPKELQKKYKDLTEPSADWSDLSTDIVAQVITPAEDETLRSALLSAVSAAEDGAILQLPKNSTLDLGDGGLYFLEYYMTKAGGTGKVLTIDLNGGTLESTTPYSNGYYYGTTIPSGGSLTLTNGKVDVDGNCNAFQLSTGAHLIMRDVDMVTESDAIFPEGDAAEVVLENCKIESGGNYAIATNALTSDNIHINISNTTLKSAGCAVLVNVPSDVHIEGSSLIGSGWGLFVRSGHVVVENTTITTTDGDPGDPTSRYNTSCEYFVYNQSASNVPYWGTGCQVPYAPVVLGDYSNGTSYNQDTDLTLTNVKFVNANATAIPDVVVAAGPSGKDVVLTYDAATTVGRMVVFGEGYVRNKFTDGDAVYGINHTFTHNGTITVNGTAKTYTGTVTSPIVSKVFSSRYTIPSAVGTFTAYTSYKVSVLNVEVDGVNILEAFKAFYADQGFTLTDAQWATASFAPGSTDNQVKTITYDSAA